MMSDPKTKRAMLARIHDCNTVEDLKLMLVDLVEHLDDSLASRGGFPWPIKKDPPPANQVDQ